jgi:hypothetical protein
MFILTALLIPNVFVSTTTTKKIELGMVVYIYHPSSSGGSSKRLTV